MRKFLVLLVGALSTAGIAQRFQVPAPSEKPLTSDEIAIYRAVIARYIKKGDHRLLNVAGETKSMGDPDVSFCASGVIRRTAAKATHEMRSLDSSVTAGFSALLVDPDKQNVLVKRPDPDSSIKQTMEHHDIREQLNNSADPVQPTGFLTLSEIVFDKQHERAIVAYRFFCGGLCGDGATLVLTKVKNKWKIKQKCGEWIS